MEAESLLEQGQLAEALADLQQNVRSNPADPKLRVFLFQLLVVLGDWKRALNQLTVLRELDPGSLAMFYTYQAALHCELLRAEIFSGLRSPLVFGQPDPWLAHLIEAMGPTVQDKPQARNQLILRAFEEAPATSGTINGEPFDWIADGDSRLGPVLEAIVNGKYYWIPFTHIKRIQAEPPADLRDLVWTRVNFTWDNDGQVVGLIPTRYQGSENSDDPQLILARTTQWQSVLEGEISLYEGMGQRLFTTDSGEYPILECRDITIG